MKKEQLLKYFDKSWLTDPDFVNYLTGSGFSNIGKQIGKERKETVIYPESEKVFRIFKELPYDKITVVLLGQDPFHDGSACGHAFCNCEKLGSPSPSLRNIIKEFDRSYPENLDKIDVKLAPTDLQYLVRQGVFLYNTALTVREKTPGSHIQLWEEFTLEVIKTLNKKDKLVYLLLGSYAHKYEKQINSKHTILKYSHPAREIYNPGSFIGCNCFVEVNKHLKKEIIW